MADHESISKTEDVRRPTPGVDLEANRVSSDYLSCEIPEGWEATYYGEGFSPLFRMSPKESGPRDDVWIDCEMGFDKDLHLENRWDTPESRLATTKSVYFSPHTIGCYFLTPLDYHTVEAHGCKCAIIQVATSNNVGLAFNIIAESSRGATLHATFSSWNNDRLDEARELVDRLAKSICVYESDTPSYVRDLQECLDSQVDPDHLFKVIARYGSVLENIKIETPDIARFVKQAYKADQRTEHERLIAAVEEYAESNKSVEPYLKLLADVADAQARYLKEDSANLDKLRQIVAETSRGSIFFPNSLPRDFRKLPQQEWEEVERVLAPSERMRAILSRIGVEWPNSDNADDGSDSDSDAVVPDLPTVMLTLLSDDYVFFQNNEISWSKGHHVIKGLQVNSPKQRDLATIAVENGFDNINDLLNYFIAFMSEVEKDEALVVPKASISKALHPIVRRGDLTGITLANLAASMAAFRVLNDRPNNYTVIYDGTLADGIPHFFDLMSRLLWDLRLCMTSLKGVPFQVTFARCRNLDLSQLLSGSVSRVDGAQDDPFSVTVSEEPAIGLEAVASEEPPAKTPSDLTSKCERLEAVLDLLLAASTEHHKASRALFANEQSAAEDKEELRRIADYKNHLEEQLESAKEEKLRLEKKLAKLLVRKSDLQGERDQLSTEINQLEEKLRELEADRKSLPFYAIFKSSQLSSKIAKLADQKNEHLDRIKAIDEKLNAITCADIEKQIQDQERKIASLPEEIEAQPQKEGEYKSRLEKTKKDHRNLAFKTTRATKQMVEALGRYNDYVGSLSFTNTERRSDEYHSLRGHVTSLISQLKEQGITAADRRAFPRLKPPMR